MERQKLRETRTACAAKILELLVGYPKLRVPKLWQAAAYILRSACENGTRGFV